MIYSFCVMPPWCLLLYKASFGGAAAAVGYRRRILWNITYGVGLDHDVLHSAGIVDDI